jgi:hypothetical protein
MTLNLANVTPPAWTEPGAQPELLHLNGGRLVFTWERIVNAAVWIAREDGITPDGQMVAGPTTIHIEHRTR